MVITNSMHKILTPFEKVIDKFMLDNFFQAFLHAYPAAIFQHTPTFSIFEAF